MVLEIFKVILCAGLSLLIVGAGLILVILVDQPAPSDRAQHVMPNVEIPPPAKTIPPPPPPSRGYPRA